MPRTTPSTSSVGTTNTTATDVSRARQARAATATLNADGNLERMQASDADVVHESTEQPYGVRDCAVRDPVGSLIRIQELR